MEFSRPEYGVSSKATAPYSSNFAWKIPWTEEPGGLQSMGSLESDTTERLHFHFSLSCIGERNGNPLQCSCLENPRDGGAWWAAIYGVAQSWTQLKRLSSSSSSSSREGKIPTLGLWEWLTTWHLTLDRWDWPIGSSSVTLLCNQFTSKSLSFSSLSFLYASSPLFPFLASFLISFSFYSIN